MSRIVSQILLDAARDAGLDCDMVSTNTIATLQPDGSIEIEATIYLYKPNTIDPIQRYSLKEINKGNLYAVVEGLVRAIRCSHTTQVPF